MSGSKVFPGKGDHIDAQSWVSQVSCRWHTPRPEQPVGSGCVFSALLNPKCGWAVAFSGSLTFCK